MQRNTLVAMLVVAVVLLASGIFWFTSGWVDASSRAVPQASARFDVDPAFTVASGPEAAATSGAVPESIGGSQ